MDREPLFNLTAETAENKVFTFKDNIVDQDRCLYHIACIKIDPKMNIPISLTEIFEELSTAFN